MEANDERHDEPRHDDDVSDVARYELLRDHALAGDPGGWRCGLGVLQHRGVIAWLHAWHLGRRSFPSRRPFQKGLASGVI